MQHGTLEYMQSKLVILLHSSKTMRTQKAGTTQLHRPTFVKEAEQLADFLKTLSTAELEKAMHVSPSLAAKTKATIHGWRASGSQTAAIDSFIGDIYSGLRAGELSQSDRDYADDTLWILSGLYGFLRPYDSIQPYRLEMGYKLPRLGNLYDFWGQKIADKLPEEGTIVNVSSVEYTKAILPFVDKKRVVTPNFLTVSPKTGQPAFTAVHAKIARGAFARWLITTRITDPQRFGEFNDLGYTFDAAKSTPNEPVFVCTTFGGLGLSIRLQ
jgi:cytoplasmic iron level regulating protein YaaA (DUF328/UPF0246 family)